MPLGNTRRHGLLLALLACACVAGKGAALADSRPWIGLELCNIPAQHPLRREPATGAYVLQVRENSPASSAGVMQDDIVIGIDDRVVASAEDLVCAIAARSPGHIVRLAIVRRRAARGGREPYALAERNATSSVRLFGALELRAK